MKRLRFFCFIKLCSKTWIFKWVENDETPRLTQNRKSISCTMDNSEPLVVSRLSSNLSSSVSTNIKINGSVQLFQKIGTMIRSSNDSKWQAGHGEPWTSKRDEQGRSNARHSCLVTALHSNLEDLEAHVLAHSSERVNSDSQGEASKVGTRTEEKCSCLLPPKTKRDLFCEQNRLVKWKQQSTILKEGRESRNNHRYAVVVQVLATQWNPCQTKTSQETEKNLRKIL